MGAFYNDKNLYNTNHLTAMQYEQWVWIDIPDEIKANCGKASGVSSSATVKCGIGDALMVADSAAFEAVLTNLPSGQKWMPIDNLLKPDNGDCLKLLMSRSWPRFLHEKFEENLCTTPTSQRTQVVMLVLHCYCKTRLRLFKLVYLLQNASRLRPSCLGNIYAFCHVPWVVRLLAGRYALLNCWSLCKGKPCCKESESVHNKNA